MHIFIVSGVKSIYFVERVEWSSWRIRSEVSKGGPSQLEAQTTSTSSLFRSPRAVSTKTDAQVAYGVRFGRSLNGWKDNFKTLPMHLVSDSNLSGVDGNRLWKLASRICSGAASLFLGRWPVYRVGAQ